MKKNSIDNRSLCNRNYVLTCAAGFLLYVLVYAVIVSVTVRHSGWAGDICFPFAMGMLIVGPFHAWLADKFRRKHILTYPFLGLLVVSWGYAHVLTSQQFSLLALLQGMCFGLASSAGITLSIDVVHSGHRTKANMVYSLVCGLGMATGIMGGLWMPGADFYNWMWPVIAGIVGLASASFIYVPFRAPIGLPVCSTDRYLLGRALLPAVNVGVVSFACGWLAVSVPWGIAGLLLLAVLSPLLVRMFVKLSHHCQRATGNMTFHLWMDAGLLFGIQTGTLSWDADTSIWWPLLLLLSGVLVFFLITRIYYRKMRVR